MINLDAPDGEEAGYYATFSLPEWLAAPGEFKATLTKLARGRYHEIDQDPSAQVLEGAFFSVIGLLMADTDGATAHRRVVWLGLSLAFAAQWPLRRAPEQSERCGAVRESVLSWLKTGKRPSAPIGEALFPMVHTGVQELNEAISVHRGLSRMPSQISSSATILLELLDLTLDGFAIRPGTDGARDIFHWWLGQAVPAAFMERLPDHVWNGFWAWPPRQAGG